MTYDPYEKKDYSEDGIILEKTGLVLDGNRYNDPLFNKFKSNDDWRNEIWYEGTGSIFTDDEIEKRTQKMIDDNEAALKEILEDGFIHYPLYLQNTNGELIEKSAWLPPTFEPSNSEGFFKKHGMETNIYVPSYERAGVAGTIKLFERYNVKNYYICIDPEQYPKYKEAYPLERLLIRDISFRDPEVLELHSSLKHPWTMAGHAPLCNFTLALSRSLGESHFSFADDDFVSLAMKAKKGYNSLQADEVYNKDDFYRCSDIKAEYGFNFQKFWHGLERIAKMMRNPGFVGLERFGTVFSLPVCFRSGTRVYSFYITSNATQIPHEGRQNNDVQTSIALSRHGLVNMLFEGVSYNSEQTQSAGGQTAMYQLLGTSDKGKVLSRAQPAITKIVDRYSRIHHAGSFLEHNKLPIVPAPIELWDTISQDDYNNFPRPEFNPDTLEPLTDEEYNEILERPLFFSGPGPKNNVEPETLDEENLK